MIKCVLYVVILLILIFIEYLFQPRLDYTDNNNLLLWYNNYKKRKYLKIF